MKIAVASGKGGTGKTTVAVNLAWYVNQTTGNAHYIDCDVEEPNGHLFLTPDLRKVDPVTVSVPYIDVDGCSACGECVRFCRYNALIRLGKKVMVFPELCHGCGGCMLVCPEKVIKTADREIGTVRTGSVGTADFTDGYLSVGEAMSPPVIRSVLERVQSGQNAIIDAPPGTSCPVIAAVRSVDYVVLVTEPTPFGFNDLSLAMDMIREIGIPHGVVVNRDEPGNSDAEEFCCKKNVEIIASIPESREIANLYSRGKLLVGNVAGLEKIFERLWKRVQGSVAS